MSEQFERIALILAGGPMRASDLAGRLKVSQPTLSRLLNSMDSHLLRIRQGRTIRYALRDSRRGFGDIGVYCVDTEGRIRTLGVLSPVRNDGYVMQQADGVTLHSESLPWWLLDMRPQGFMGRAYARKFADALGLPASLKEWSDTHAMRALLAHGDDVSGNLLLGDLARARFLDAPVREPMSIEAKSIEYVRLSKAAIGADETWSSAGGEQPKFTAYVHTAHGPRHVIVKFAAADDNPVAQRWRDLLLAEHLAMETLLAHDVVSSKTAILDLNGQRFLEVERFDRVGARGRRGLLSLAAVDAEFAGMGTMPWPDVTHELANHGHITTDAHLSASLLYAFGCLIGNTDMHHGNLAFLNSHDRPYDLAPAYDMLPMTFQPHTGGMIVDVVNPVPLHAKVLTATWHRALGMANSYMGRLAEDDRFSAGFIPCRASLQKHLQSMAEKIALLA